VQVYTSGVLYFGVPFHIPTFEMSWPGSAVSTPVDALPTLPSWVAPNGAATPFVWAPTVRVVAGRYLMMFGASRAGGAMCIGAATSGNAGGPFAPTTVEWCDPDPRVGWLDPSLLVDGDGSIWLTWSRQWSTRGGSEIVAQRLTGDGLGLVGSRSTLVSFVAAASATDGRNFGPAPFVENPALVRDGHNGYDLLVSIGTWTDTSYRTVEIPCLLPYGACVPSRGADISASMKVGDVSSVGGASVVVDDGRNGDILLFHGRTAASGGNRWAFATETRQLPSW
jgi:hypothetical protein